MHRLMIRQCEKLRIASEDLRGAAETLRMFDTATMEIICTPEMLSRVCSRAADQIDAVEEFLKRNEAHIVIAPDASEESELLIDEGGDA